MKFRKFPDISYILLKTREATRTYEFVTNSHGLFHLRSKEHLLNHQKVSKYFEHDYI